MEYDYTLKDPECNSKTKKLQDFYYWKSCRDSYQDALKNGTFDISKDGNYAEYFVKKYVLGKFYYNLLRDFNKKVISKLKQPVYESYLTDNLQKLNGEFDIDKFLFCVDPIHISVKSFTDTAIGCNNIRENSSYVNRVMNGISIRNKEYDNETCGLLGEFSFRILNLGYDAKLRQYLSVSTAEERHQNFKVSVSNFKDNEGKIYQVLSISLNVANENYEYPDQLIVFYYTPSDHPTYSADAKAKNRYDDFTFKDVDCLLNYYQYGYDPSLYTNNRIHLYRCDKPIFNENQLKIFRTYSFITWRSHIEEQADYYHSESKSATRKHFEKILKAKYPQMDSDEISLQMVSDYPMYTGKYFQLKQKNEVMTSLFTQIDKQLFFATVLKALNNIENNLSTNSIEQDKSYITDSFVSSRDALVPLMAKDSRKVGRIFITDNTINYTMLLNKMIFDATQINDLC